MPTDEESRDEELWEIFIMDAKIAKREAAQRLEQKMRKSEAVLNCVHRSPRWPFVIDASAIVCMQPGRPKPEHGDNKCVNADCPLIPRMQ